MLKASQPQPFDQGADSPVTYCIVIIFLDYMPVITPAVDYGDIVFISILRRF